MSRTTPTALRAAVLLPLLATVSVAAAGPARADTSPSPAPGTGSSAASTGTSGSAASGASFGLGPATQGQNVVPYFSFQLGPGGHYRDRVQLLNFSAQPITLDLYAADLGNASDGSLLVGASSAKPKAAGAWIALARPHLAVKVPPQTLSGPGRVVVPFTVTVPANATPGDHAAALVASLNTLGRNAQSQNVRLEQRVASRVYLRVSGAVRPGLEVTDVQVRYVGTANPVGRGTAEVTYTLRNTGNVSLGARVGVGISGPVGSAAADDVDLPVVFPGGSAQETVSIPDVVPAIRLSTDVHVQPVAAPGEPAPQLAPLDVSESFWAIPWTLVGLVLLVVGGVVTWLRLRRRPAPPTVTSSARHSRTPVGVR